MFRIKRLRSAAHSVAHHGVSALSFLHPRLGEECKRNNHASVEIDLLSGILLCDTSRFTHETIKASKSLSRTFKDLLIVEKIDVKDIKNAIIEFHFIRGKWPSSCEIVVAIADGRDVHCKVDQFGNMFGRKAVRW